ncbi:5'-nucleotidase [Pelagicoccus sp. SDUM812003]|uniref:5'-nucleotidase n=1 Tax=Pelagicoccus sp. SDUM812003 TaxID=3041267 RepID=UPI00280DD0B2|nr:5'-nucleotidase [Pelagicoccus sp. SDUM812003]MDQ8204138.1 5'-nucleotidase [Pelagicoccus sp. SDUM812003]
MLSFGMMMRGRGIWVGALLGWAAALTSASAADTTQGSEVIFEALPVSSDLPADAEMADYLRPFREGVEAFAAEVIGVAAEPLTRTRPECGLSNLVADSLRFVGETEFEAPVDLAVTNFGGLRRDLPEGPLTMGLIMELSPFENYLTYLEVKGELVEELARQIAGSGGVAVSGIRVAINSDQEVVEARINGELIDPRKTYRMVSIDYLVSTWDRLFKPEWIIEKDVSTNLVQRDAIVLHLSQLTRNGIEIRDAGEGRVFFVE